jgi:SAM-dependent methyltransferase
MFLRMDRSISRRFAPAHNEPELSRAQRRARGIYYTPPIIVEQLVRLTLRSLPTRSVSEGTAAHALRVLDAACGAGAMLAAVQWQLAPLAQVQLFGIDTDPQAVAACRKLLGRDQSIGVWQGDALFDERLDKLSPFDAIVGNPPYVNIRQLAKSVPEEYIERLRRRFRTARGNFDLYVPFVERAWELLAPGGSCGLVLPNKWATLDYARPLRELLVSGATIEHVVDLSSVRVFSRASVYPHLLVFAKRPPLRSHAVQYHSSGLRTTVRQRLLSPAAISFAGSLDVESRVVTKPLGELATISCGTPGYSAQRVAATLHEAPVGRISNPSGTDWKSVLRDFITSGNIDRYTITLGNVRYLGRTYDRPVLPLDSPALTDRQRRLFASQKIVVAGLSQRLEAAWDDVGLALGVQVFALSDFQIDPQHLLAVLNSKLLSYLFRTRFAAKRLAGGYMAINKGQLARLPIVVPCGASDSLVKSLGRPSRLSYSDSAVDRFVYRLYRLTKSEIARIDSHFANLGRKAA